MINIFMSLGLIIRIIIINNNNNNKTLGTITKSHHKWLKEVNKTISFQTLQKACLLGAAKVLRYTLNV